MSKKKETESAPVDAPKKVASATQEPKTGKFPKSNKSRLPRREKKAQKKLAGAA